MPAIGIALANLAALALMIGIVGASRAYSVGLHTLFLDQLPAVAISLAGAALVSVAFGRRLQSSRELAVILGFALAADVGGALAVTLVFDEMRRVADFAIPRAVFTETVGGLQLLAIAGGAAIGHRMGRPREREPVS